MSFKNYIKLMRLDKPIGLWLLWAPTAWALWFANSGHPPLYLVIVFSLGVILMRSAGCIMNDIADRNIDKHVERTKTRPLAANQLGLFSAFILLALLLIASLILLIYLPISCIPWALLALGISAAYPLFKRFFHCPQLILGLAFSLGIPMAYSASFHDFDRSFWLLLIINFLWIVAYDTEYAMSDKKDDLRIGVRSSAILFATYDRLIIGILQLSAHSLWLILGFRYKFSAAFYLGWLVAALFFIYQQNLLRKGESQYYLEAFRSNGHYGLIMWILVITGFALN